MQSAGLQQILHDPVLAEAAHSLAPVRQVARLRAMLQNFYLGVVLKGTYLHPHIGKTFQMRLPRVQSRLPSGRQAIHAQKIAPKHDLHRAKDPQELYQAQADARNGAQTRRRQ